MKGGLTLNLMLMLFCLLFALRAFGYETGAEYIATFDFTSDAGFYLLLSGIGGAFLGLTIAGGVMSRLGGSSFSVIYVIPAMAFGALATMLISPIGMLINTAIPDFVKLFVMGIIYLMSAAVGYGFIRGMEV